jgi:hypothetical protein
MKCRMHRARQRRNRLASAATSASPAVQLIVEDARTAPA